MISLKGPGPLHHPVLLGLNDALCNFYPASLHAAERVRTLRGNIKNWHIPTKVADTTQFIQISSLMRLQSLCVHSAMT